ncbi:hypothetical protein NFI96_030373 [Prochilodus magdalenae]|nr:hypothetical protein NFI96_030373 [Prochilodus magdalenae]
MQELYQPPISKLGKPIKVEKNEKPTAEDLDALHQLYMDELTQLFEEHKGKYGIPEDSHLEFLYRTCTYHLTHRSVCSSLLQPAPACSSLLQPAPGIRGLYTEPDWLSDIEGTGSSILSALLELPSAPWLSKSKLVKHLQVISVLQFILTFLALGIASTVLLVYLFCTDCWVIAAIYTAWLIFDWNTPKQGGRRSTWVRNWTVWTYFRDYFPIRQNQGGPIRQRGSDEQPGGVLSSWLLLFWTLSCRTLSVCGACNEVILIAQLIKTHNLLPSRNYIFGYHPHGIFCFGAFCNFSTEATGFSKKFPGIRPSLATLAGNFRLPLLRDYMMFGGEEASSLPTLEGTSRTLGSLYPRPGPGGALVLEAPWSCWRPGPGAALVLEAPWSWRRPGPGGALVLEAPWSWRRPGPGGALVLVAPWSWRRPGPGGALVLVAPWSWRRPGPGGALVLMVPWSWRHPGPGGALVLEAPWSWRRPGPGGALVLVAPWSWWRPGPGGALVLEAPWSWRCPGPVGALVLEEPWSYWHPGPNGALVLEAPWWRPDPGGALVLEAPWSWWRPGPGGALVLVAPWSWWRPGPGGALVLVAPWSWRRPGPGGALVLEAPWSWWRPGPGGALVLEAPWSWRRPGPGDTYHISRICPVNRNSIDYLLSRNGTGNAVVIVVGGAAESLDCAPGMNAVTLRNRKGFVKLALQKGADLVPVYSFGENEAYKQVIFAEGSWWRQVQRRLQKLLGFAPCLFHGCGFFSSESWGMVPYCKPINTVVGEPITVPKVEDPPPDMIDMYHTMYIKSLTTLFDNYKTRFGLKETDSLLVH